jgi:putative lipoic acid-binding regulatory protein
MNSNSTEPEDVSDGLENGSKRGNYSGLEIDAGGSKQARASGDTVPGIKEEDSNESSSGNYSGLAIDSGLSKKSKTWPQ